MAISIAEKSIGRSSSAFKLLGDPTRLKIMNILFNSPGGICVGEIAKMASISQSAASHQLAKLEAHGVVNCTREGKNVCYHVCNTNLTKKLIRAIKTLS